jgi:hypothetical protein
MVLRVRALRPPPEPPPYPSVQAPFLQLEVVSIRIRFPRGNFKLKNLNHQEQLRVSSVKVIFIFISGTFHSFLISFSSLWETKDGRYMMDRIY